MAAETVSWSPERSVYPMVRTTARSTPCGSWRARETMSLRFLTVGTFRSYERNGRPWIQVSGCCILCGWSKRQWMERRGIKDRLRRPLAR
jgi:hypothetical protein